jgi:hypothetical protein
MAQDIEVKVKVDTGQAVSDVNKLGSAFDSTAKDAQDAQEVLSKTGSSIDLEPSIANLKRLKRELKNTAVGTKDFDALSMSIRDMEDAINDAKKSNDDFLGQMENAPGILGMVGKGIRSTETLTSSFAGALKATGIGLIVALLGGLAAAFSDNEVAMKKIQPLFDGLKKITFGIFKAVEPLVDVFLDLAMTALPHVTKAVGMVYSGMMAYFTFLKEAGGGAMEILEGVFTLDGDKISGGIDKVSGSFGKATGTFKSSMKAFGEGTKQLTESEKEAAEKQKELLEKQAEAKKKKLEEEAKEQERLKKEREDFLKSIADLEKKQAEAIRDSKAVTEQEKLDLQAQRDLEEIEALKAKGANIELLMKQHNEKYALLDAQLQEKLAKEKKEKDDEAQKKADEDARTAFEKQQAENLLRNQNQMEAENVTFEEKRRLIAERETLLLADTTLTEEQKVAIHKQTADAQLKIDEAKAQAQTQLINKVSSTMSGAAALLGENTAAAKGLAVASALINTYQGITAELATKTTTPFEIGLKIANVAIIAATGFKAVKNILATKVPGSSGGGGGGAMSAPPVAMPSASSIAGSGVNQLASTIGNQNQQPIKTYVVANDVTSQQGMDRSIIKGATIG